MDSNKKGKQLAQLKSVHGLQLSRLQQRHQQDLELLDDLRYFARQRSVIEKIYAQSLTKLVNQLITKRSYLANTANNNNTNNETEQPNHDNEQHRRLLDVWRSVLLETGKIAKHRISSSESYVRDVSEPCKPLRACKAQAAKSVFEQLYDLQKDIAGSAQEINKLQKIYKEDEHMTHEARLKAEAADNKVKNRSIGLFTSMNKLQQQSNKLNLALEQCLVRSTAACNEYMLSLASANAQLSHYYTTDLPQLTTLLDGDFYTLYSHLVEKLCRTEIECSNLTTDSFSTVFTDSTKVSREHDQQCFFNENAVFIDVVKFPKFLPRGGESQDHVSRDHEAESELLKHARAWSIKVARETNAQKLNNKRLEEMLTESKNCASGSLDLLALQTKCDFLRSVIRKSEVEKAKAEGRLEALRKAGINVDEWLNSALNDPKYMEEEMNQSGAEDLSTVNKATNGSVASLTLTNTSSPPMHGELKPRPVSVATDDGIQALSGDSALVVTTTQDTYLRYHDDEIDDHAPSSKPDQLNKSNVTQMLNHNYPIWCRALYDYEAENDDELSLQENDNIEIIGNGMGDGWFKARNAMGEEGLIPENYIKVWNPADDDDDDDDVVELNVDNGLPPPPADPTPPPLSTNSVSPHGKEGLWARALYDYSSEVEGELSFNEGDLIQVTSIECSERVDDGWWLGVANGDKGMFPSLMVELVENFDDMGMGNEMGKGEALMVAGRDASDAITARIVSSYDDGDHRIPKMMGNVGAGGKQQQQQHQQQLHMKLLQQQQLERQLKRLEDSDSLQRRSQQQQLKQLSAAADAERRHHVKANETEHSSSQVLTLHSPDGDDGASADTNANHTRNSYSPKKHGSESMV